MCRNRPTRGLFSMIAVLAACGGSAPQRSEPAGGNETHPTLQTIMVDLGNDAALLASALWIENYEAAAAAARAIAEHPTVPERERLMIAETLGGDFAAFVREDRAVHDLALEIEAAAMSRQSATVVERYGTLAAACVRCHAAFRDRVGPRLLELRGR